MKFYQRLASCMLMIGILLAIPSGCAASPAFPNEDQGESAETTKPPENEIGENRTANPPANEFHISDYVPDYASKSTRNADLFLDKLKCDGYHRGDEIDKKYNTNNITGVFNITPKGIAENNPDLEFFYPTLPDSLK